MGDTAGRMLELMGLLQARPEWSGPDLAERLEITERTLRRDIDRLRRLGYPVHAATGPGGGYRMGRGANLPPLLLSEEEAVAVAIGLRQAVDGSITGIEDSVVGVLTKLDRLLAAPLARRVRSVHESTASLAAPVTPPPIRADSLLLLAHACSSRHRVRFSYSDRAGRPTTRLVEPVGVVRAGLRWYLAARDIDRADWRTFRLDRMGDVDDVGTIFDLGDAPSAVELVARSLASMPAPFTARVRIALPAEEAVGRMPPVVAVLDSGPAGTVFEVGSTSMERMAAWAASMVPPCEILDPPELRRRVAEHAARVADLNTPG